MGGRIPGAAIFPASVHQRAGTDRKRDPGASDLLLWDLHDGAPVCRAVHECGAEPAEAGSIFLPVPESDHRRAADDPVAHDRRSRNRRRVLGGTGVECSRGNGVLCDNARHGMAVAERNIITIMWQ